MFGKSLKCAAVLALCLVAAAGCGPGQKKPDGPAVEPVAAATPTTPQPPAAPAASQEPASAPKTEAPAPAREKDSLDDLGLEPAERLALEKRYNPLFEPKTQGGPAAALEALKAARKKVEARIRFTQYRLNLTPEAERAFLKACTDLVAVEDRVVEYIIWSAQLDQRVGLLRQELEKAVEEGHAVSPEARKALVTLRGGDKQPHPFEGGSFGYATGDIRKAAATVRAKVVEGQLLGDDLFGLMEATADCGIVIARCRERNRQVRTLVDALPERQRLRVVEDAFFTGSKAEREYQTERDQLAKRTIRIDSAVTNASTSRDMFVAAFPEFAKKLRADFLDLEEAKREFLVSVFRRPDGRAWDSLLELDRSLASLNRVLNAAIPDFAYQFRPLVPAEASRKPEDNVAPPLALPGTAADEVPVIALTGKESIYPSVEVRVRRRPADNDHRFRNWEECLDVMVRAVRMPQPSGRKVQLPEVDHHSKPTLELAFERMAELPVPADADVAKRAHKTLVMYYTGLLNTGDESPLFLRVMRGDYLTRDREPASALVLDAAYELAASDLFERDRAADTVAELGVRQTPDLELAPGFLGYATATLNAAAKAKRPLTAERTERVIASIEACRKYLPSGEEAVERLKALHAALVAAEPYIADSGAGLRLRQLTRSVSELGGGAKTSEHRAALEAFKPLPEKRSENAKR